MHMVAQIVFKAKHYWGNISGLKGMSVQFPKNQTFHSRKMWRSVDSLSRFCRSLHSVCSFLFSPYFLFLTWLTSFKEILHSSKYAAVVDIKPFWFELLLNCPAERLKVFSLLQRDALTSANISSRGKRGKEGAVMPASEVYEQSSQKCWRVIYMYTVFSCTSCLVPVRAAGLVNSWPLCATAVAHPQQQENWEHIGSYCS